MARRWWRRKVTAAMTVTFAVAIAVAVVVASPAGAWLSAAMTGVGSSSATPAPAGPTLTLAAQASAADLYPGRLTTAQVKVTNTSARELVVVGLSGGESSAVGACPAGVVAADGRLDGLGLTQADGSTRVVAAGGSGVYDVAVRMASSAPAACAGATFTIGVTAVGERAG